MNADELKRLEDLVDAATPGPWEFADDPDSFYAFHATDSDGLAIFENSDAEDAAFIAAANPDTIKRLVARVRELEARDATWRRRRVEGLEHKLRDVREALNETLARMVEANLPNDVCEPLLKQFDRLENTEEA